MTNKPPSSPEDRIVTASTGTIHDSFQMQIQTLLCDQNISDEDRQRILTNLTCPCCGGAAASFTVKLGE